MSPAGVVLAIVSAYAVAMVGVAWWLGRALKETGEYYLTPAEFAARQEQAGVL